VDSQTVNVNSPKKRAKTPDKKKREVKRKAKPQSGGVFSRLIRMGAAKVGAGK
jgi:hypothetical protein